MSHRIRRFSLLLAALVAASSAETARNDDRPEAETAELRQLTLRRFEANAANDRGAYERLLAPNFLLLEAHSFPARTKQGYLDAEFPAGRPARAPGRVRDFQALVESDTAVVSYEVAEPYPIGGDQHFEAVSRRLDTYVRRDGAWRLLAMATAEPPSWPDVAPIDARLLADYAGTYRLSPTTLVEVTHEAGHLMARVSGQEKIELFPENATTFFDRTDSPLARTVFERDADGRVAVQVYRSMGQTLRATRVR